MADSNNAKSKREFKKLSKHMGDKLDKEKGKFVVNFFFALTLVSYFLTPMFRSIEELEAPDFKHNSSTNVIRQRAVEKERNREASQNARPGTIERMQFTFNVDQLKPSPTPPSPPSRMPDLKPSSKFKNGGAHRRSKH